MAFADVARKIKYPSKTTARFKRLDAYDRLRAGTFYDHIPTPFSMEYAHADYVPLLERRPSIIWNGAKLLVDQLSGLMWGDEQMPIVRTYFGDEPAEEDRNAEQGIQHLVETLDLDAVMDDATDAASSGSCAVVVRATDDKQAYIQVIPGRECTPKFDPFNPFKMVDFEQLYPTTGEKLAEAGYEIADEDLRQDFWFRMTIDDRDETWFQPMRSDRFERLGEKDDQGIVVRWVVDEDRSGPHGWPCINVVWMKAPKGKTLLDGACLYEDIKDVLVEIDYMLSQCGRGFRYSADPMLYLRRGELRSGAAPATRLRDKQETTQKDSAGRIIKSPAQVIDGEPGGDAKLLEISGQGLSAMGDFIKQLREWGLEICGGMKSDSETTKGVESGRALEILYQALILVLKRWRVALGNKGFVPLVRLLLTGIDAKVIAVEGLDTSISPDTTMRLVWPTWMTPSGSDLLATANAWQTLAGGSTMAPVPVLPREIVSRMAGTNLGLNDTSAMLEQLNAQVAEDEQKAAEQAQQQHAQALDLAAAKPPPPKAAPAKK